ncbi:hypothetical protein L905_19080 [Agrobacterium sp. TS43]|uniref:hypothetical protein n=1 Tax=Agrobacterium TaxID=357 RepID=UPI0004A0A737|nr:MULTISPECIES: hypothetical protein [Agrobacterium]KDR87703.1 hypothetical protein K538_07045 [Agrobacterium tumefaciens GW4]KVK49497.1 hypothetical protein L903_19440 [Agrobacterium sp. JL28]KVK49734.1 hypothetical protein L904_19430 [Agrobacterium sp. LY4]KVK62675.1 hypothetical protein L906_18555 [Agrobacterium sp. TS45]KVK65060.1 hypothetical protein L905_19080 [Agrobacterium sp. TS43]
MAAENRPNVLWPVGTKVTYLNAYGLEPVEGVVIKHYGETNVLVEDGRGVRHFGATWRIATAPPSSKMIVDLDDLIDTPPVKPKPVDLDDLLV